MKKAIYLDHAAATPQDARVTRAMDRAAAYVGNPSSYNAAGREAAAVVEDARLLVARFLGAHADEIVFTSSGSEANALAIRGICRKYGTLGDMIITTPIEHLSVLESVRAVAREKHMKVRSLSVDMYGRIHSDELVDLITNKTTLVSVMYANNEIGTIEPIAEIAAHIQSYRAKHQTSLPYLHVDACQATDFLNMNVEYLGADLMTFNGAKIYGPRGTGVLYIRRGVEIEPLVVGGGQERGRRAGTENTAGIVGLATAIGLIDRKHARSIQGLRDYFLQQIANYLPDARVNGALEQERLPNNVNVSIPGLESEKLLLELEKYGITASSGSACTAHSVEPSHVLKAIGAQKPYVDGALRFSLGRTTTRTDIDAAARALVKAVGVLRQRYGELKK